MITVNPKDTRPIYAQIIQQVKLAIATGLYKPGDQIPSVRELSARLVVNPNTVLKAFAELEREGVVKAKRGQGYFVGEASKQRSEEERMKMFAELCHPVVAEGIQLELDIRKIMHVIESSFHEIKSGEKGGRA